MFRIPNVPWANWNSYLEGGGLQGEEIVKSTLFCKVHYVLNSDIKNLFGLREKASIIILSESSSKKLLSIASLPSLNLIWQKLVYFTIN
jgi:hypothetical protein